MRWKTVKLGDVIDVVMGQAPPGQACNKDGIGTPFVKAGEFGALSPVIKEWTTEPKKMGVKGDVFLCVVGATCGKINLGADCSIGRSVAALRPHEGTLLQMYLFYFMSQQVMRLRGGSLGAAQTVISKDMINNMSLTLPPLAEQQRIVAKLDAAFAEIDRAIEIGQERLSRTAKAFGQMVDIELGKLRQKYERCLLGEMLDSVEYGTSTKCLKSGKYPVLRMGNMQAGSITMDDLVYLDADEEFQKYRVRKGDVFFNRTNSALHVGKSAIYEGKEDCLFAGYLIRLNHSGSLLDGRFLNYYLNAPSTRTYGYSVMTSSVNQSNINGTKLKEYPFFKVDLETQRLIRKKLDDVTSLLSQAQFAIKKSLNEYAQLKSAILAQELQPPQSEAA